MATFTEDEVEFLRLHGNEECAKTWLGLWDAKRVLKMDHKDFMIEKYERKRFFLEPASPLKSIPSTTKQLSSMVKVAATESRQQNGQTSQNNNFSEPFPHIEDPSELFKHCKPANQVNSSHTDFVADFSKVDTLNVEKNSSKGLSNGNGVHDKAVNGSTTDKTMENFADFEHNQIYNAAGKFNSNLSF